MELPSINNKNNKNNSLFGRLKLNNKFAQTDKAVLNSLKTDNLFFKQKLAEFEVRLDNIGQTDLNKYNSSTNNKDSKFNRFNNAKLRESTKFEQNMEEDSMAAFNHNETSRRKSVTSQSSARLNTGRSSIFTSRTNDSGVSKIDEILNNLKKHRRSAVRRDVYDTSTHNFDELNRSNSRLRPKTSANLPQVSSSRNSIYNESMNNFDIPNQEFAAVVAREGNNHLSRKSAKSSSKSIKAKASRAKTAKTEAELAKDDEYCHMFYSRSWRIHPELGLIKDKDRTTYDNTQTNFYHTTKQPPETFIFSPDWV